MSLIKTVKALMVVSVVVLGAANLQAMKRETNDGLDERLLKALKLGDFEKVKVLVEDGADVDGRDDKGLTLLHLAALNGELEICKCLIANGADVGGINNDGFIPLHSAAHGGQLEVCKYLVSKGAKVEEKSTIGSTPLHLAAYGGQLEVCRYLVFKGADVNNKDKQDCSPLYLAALKGKLEVFKVLVWYGGKIDEKNKPSEGPSETPIEILERKFSKKADDFFKWYTKNKSNCGRINRIIEKMDSQPPTLKRRRSELKKFEDTRIV